MADPVRISVAVADGTVSCLEWPAAGPALHFAHANGFNAQTYQVLLGPLAEHFHIYASDQRGHGFSTLPTPPGFAGGWRQFGDDLVRLLEAMDCGPMLLAGHSMGAIASLMAAASRPDLVSALVLVEPVFVPAVPRGLLRLARGFGVETNKEFAARAARRRDRFESAEEAMAAYRGRGAFRNWPDEVLRDYVAGGFIPAEDGGVRLACAPRVEAEIFAAAPIAAYRLANRVRCAVMLICGEVSRESSCGAYVARAFRRGKPDTRVVAVPGPDISCRWSGPGSCARRSSGSAKAEISLR